MAEAVTTIRLYGKMGAQFGRRHEVLLSNNTPADAVKWLCSQFPKAKKYLLNAIDDDVVFAVFRGKENIGKEQLDEPVGNNEIRIAPIIRGSKRMGLVQIIVGIILIVVAVVDYGTTSETTAAYWGAILSGSAMIVGGVIQMLTPLPSLTGGDAATNKANYVFQGAVNTQAQGNPVPLLYGRMIVGSAVISAAIKSEFYQPPQRTDPGRPWIPGKPGDPTLGYNPRTPYDTY